MKAPEVDLTFPLVQLVAPDMRLSAWRRFARKRAIAADNGTAVVDLSAESLPSQQGIVVQSGPPRDALNGLFAYRVLDDPQVSRLLIVHLFTVAHLFDLDGCQRAMLSAVHETAEGLDCAAIHFCACQPHGLPTSERLTDALSDAGYEAQLGLFCQTLKHNA